MDVHLSKPQAEAFQSETKHTAFVGGIGSGKSFLGALWAYTQMIRYPKCIGLITAESYDQLMSATLPTLYKILDGCGQPYEYNGHRKELIVNDTKTYCRSAETYDRQRGIEVGWWWADEAAYYKKDAFLTLSGRLRDASGPLRAMYSSTPKGHNWLYDYFHPNGELNSNQYSFVRAASRTNRHLPDGYLDSLRSQYDEKLVEQELEGKFVNLTAGKVYYSFDRSVNIEQNIKRRGGSTLIGVDFNVDPLCAVVAFVENDKIYVTDELFLRNSNTFELCHELKKRGYTGAKLYPDSTGRNRKTSGQSDTNILSSEGFQVEYTRNPYVIDRVNNLNRLISQKKIIVSDKCKKLINDLEKVTWKGSDLDQKTDPLLTHMSDSLGYLAWSLYPIRDTSIKGRIKLH